MTSNIRKCDVCGTVFEINERSHAPHNYNKIELPIPGSLKSIIERVMTSNARGYRSHVNVDLYDVCADCITAICEAMLVRRELEDG